MKELNIIFKILNILRCAMETKDFDAEKRIGNEALHIGYEMWVSIIEMLIDDGYVKNAEVTEYIDGEVDVDISNIKITMKGLEYLAENNVMKKIANGAKGIVDVIK